MNTISKELAGKNVLIMNNQAGGGHRSAVEAINEQVNLNKGIPIIKDIFTDVLGNRMAKVLYNFWNNAMKGENLDDLKLPLKFQAIGEFFLGIPEFFTVFYWLIAHKVDAVVNPQPAGLHAITKAVICANFINKYILKNKKEILVYNVLTELPTKHTSDFFCTYKRLNESDRKICRLISAKPLIDTPIESSSLENAEEAFWKIHSGFDLKNIIYEEFPLRSPFLDYSEKDPKHIRSLSIAIKNEKAKQLVEESGALHSKIIHLGKNTLEIGEEDSVGTIMLGSQAGTKSTLKYVSDLIKLNNDKQKTKQKQYIFVFCGDCTKQNEISSCKKVLNFIKKFVFFQGESPVPETHNLFNKVCDLIKIKKEENQYPDNLYIIPLENQKADEIAPIFRKSKFTITRAGGITAQEIYKVATGRIFIHSKEKDPFKGMPEWEAGNVLYLQEKKGAQILTLKNSERLLAPITSNLLNKKGRFKNLPLNYMAILSIN